MIGPALLPYGLAATACLVSAIGGYLTLRLKRRLGPVFALCAGVLIGVASLDMLPEAARLLPSIRWWEIGAASLAGGVGLLALGGILPALSAGARLAPHLGPASLTLHSLVEGLGIGLGFELSPQIGWAVAAGVLAHDLADGVNVASLGLATGSRVAARRWLVANSLAPIAGVAAAQVLAVSAVRLGWVLAALAGVFVVIAVRELARQAVRLVGPAAAALGMLAGFGLVYASTWAAG